MVENNEVKIVVPEGYEIDTKNSTFECIKFKKKGPTFKVGDLVRIKSKKFIGKFNSTHSGWRTTDEMVSYARDITKITYVSAYKSYNDGEGDGYLYKVEVDNSRWCWRDFCFEPVTESDEELYELRNKVIEEYPVWGQRFVDNVIEQHSTQKAVQCLGELITSVDKDGMKGIITRNIDVLDTPEGAEYWYTVQDYLNKVVNFS